MKNNPNRSMRNKCTHATSAPATFFYKFNGERMTARQKIDLLYRLKVENERTSTTPDSWASVARKKERMAMIHAAVKRNTK